MKKTVFFLIIWITISCQKITNSNNVLSTKTSDMVKNRLAHFIKNKGYKVSYSKIDIPKFLLDTLNKRNGNNFLIGDNTDDNRIDLSDVHNHKNAFNKKLHFIYFSDSICLITYRQGGLGTSDVIDYFEYGKKWRYERLETLDSLDTQEKLLKYIKKQ
jgi:hypothetical protein